MYNIRCFVVNKTYLTMTIAFSEDIMRMALKEAEVAQSIGEVPVGAVIVDSRNNVIAKGYNLREKMQSPTAHAELIAVEEACKTLNSWRLEDCSIYVTLEPCPMCMGLLLQCRIKQIFFGAFDPKAGACGSIMDLSDNKRLNHRIEVLGGILEEESSELLKKFFKNLRLRDADPA